MSEVEDDESAVVDLVTGQANTVAACGGHVGVINPHSDRAARARDQSRALSSALIYEIDEAVSRVWSSEELKHAEKVLGGVVIFYSIASYAWLDQSRDREGLNECGERHSFQNVCND